MKKRIVVYCQHLSGAGHFVRSREIVRSLSQRHEVWFVVGGSPVPGPPLDAAVHSVQLPAIHRTANGLEPLDSPRSIEEVFAERSILLDRLLREVSPDVLMVEHFPFSKWILRRELMTAIDAARAANRGLKVLSSVRDYPAGHELEASAERYRDEVLHTLNECFDALLVHSDPSIARLESQFLWVPQITIPIHYTGYVAETVPDRTLTEKDRFEDSLRRRVIVSSGGLRDGFRLAKLCAAAWTQLHERGLLGGREMVIFAGLFAEKEQYASLEQMIQGGPFRLRRFGDDFLSWMRNSDLSISQAGYNTTMNVLETRTRAILAPNRVMTDQTKRAQVLGERGLIDVIDVETITAEQLSSRILDALSRPRPEHSLDMNGSRRTCDLIDSLTRTNLDSAVQASAVIDDASCSRFADQLAQTDNASRSPDTFGSADELIMHRFERFAAERPTHLAIKTPTEELSFASLNASANQLARFIRSQYDVSKRPMVLLIEPGPEHAVGILGILKAGRCYVPLRTSHPLQRLRFILDDSQADLLVTNSLNLPLAQELANGRIPIVNLDAVDQAVPCHDLKLAISPDSHASITYTSGSSGQPKGVIHSHRSTLYSGRAAGDANITLNDRVLAAGSTISFNRVMINGATVYPWHVAQEGLYHLADWIQSEDITVLLSVPSVFRNFAATLTERHRFPSLRRVVLTGETLYRKDAMLFREHFPSECVLVNELGSSETKSYVQFVIDRNTVIVGDIVPVGFELEGRQIQLLGDNGRDVRIGEVGQIIVRSRHMSEGYLNRPELTNERFGLDPESDGERIYRTGDLAYQLPDGCFVHVGREDFQLKIRGQRTELGEIEATLRHLNSVREAVVVALSDSTGDTRLVAYVVADSTPRPTVSSLAEGLRARLPAHMIPRAFVLLDALPMTPNGKIDRLALPAPGRSRPNLAVPYAEPRDGIEETLVQFWSEVLDVDQVGIRDDFYELGGDSLRATMVHSRIIEKFRVQLPLRDVFHMRTIAELGQAIASATPQSVLQNESLKPIQIQSRDKAATFPASFAQQRLWLLHHIDASAAYNDIVAWRIAGPLNIDVLRHALDAVVNRHEVLRTTLRSNGEQIVQTIEGSRPVELVVVDLEQQLAGDERETAMTEDLVAAAKRPFDLSRDSVLRARLVRLSDHEHVLALTLHHIATDGWSSGILARDIAAFYNAFCAGTEPQLVKLPIQYADYSVWQRESLSSGELRSQLDYWRKQLEGASETLELPTDRPRGQQKSDNGARHSFQFSASVSNSLRQLSRDAGTTLFATIASAFATLLSRYSDSYEIVLGTPIAGRRRVESEGLVGFFINTLALRIDLGGDPTFQELLQRVHGVAVDAFAHQDVPFEKLVEELRPQRRLSHTPLFQVMFVLQNAPRRELKLRGLESSRIAIHNGTSKYDLTVTLVDAPEGLRGRLEYNTDLFDGSTIARMADHFATLLEGIVVDADRRISALPLMTEKERHRLLVEWNDTAVDFPNSTCIHQLFEEQVERNPGAIAVIFRDQRLTYRELNERANQLAHYLLGLGVGPETLVGLCLERSPELVVGILGILKAGGAYVPLDVELPAKRLEFMLQDAKLQFIVTQQGLRDRLPVCDWQAVYIELEYARIEVAARSNPASGVRVENLAYVMFTSGSTGTPKGVAIEHRSAANLLSSMCRFLPEKSLHKFFGVASPTFDISVAELFAPLIIGGATLLPSRRDSKDPQLLAAMIDHLRPSVIQATPATWSALIENGWNADTEKTLISTGEALPKVLGRQLLKLGRLFDLYGPTETTIWSCQNHVQAAEQIGSIGTPISNTQVYVLDEHRQPQPIGVPGELYIGGAGLARGYLNRPELTAEKFVPNPFSDDADSRLYRTGDLCRWRSDGNLEFMGRIDDQVKLRGYRIELGEIEAAMNEHPSVAQGVVALREDRPGDKRLVAYCVAASDSELKFTELRSYLQQRLPDYMLPAAFVRLDSLPLTPSGKVNRRALPAPDESRPDLETHYVAPGTPVEQQLSRIWAEVLGIEAMGIHDNFFALGGHSLLATRVIARFSSALQVDLPLRKLFEAPTIAELASEIETLRNGGLIANSTALMRVDRDQIDRLPLSFAQQRLWFLEQMEGELTAYNMPYAWRLNGSLNVDALRRALEEVVRRHEPLRTTFSVVDGDPVQVIRKMARWELPLEDLGELATDQQTSGVMRRFQVEAERPFDLTSDLALRTSLLRLNDQEHVLLLTMHHIASDGWSLQVFRRELETLYKAYCVGAGEAGLADLPVQYADYAVWQRRVLEGQRLETLLEYWRNQLNGVTALELPSDHSRPARPSYRGAEHSFELPEVLVSQLKRLSQAAGVTLHMTLLAAFQTLLSRYSGQDDIAVGVPVAGRNQTDLEDLIGFFVNTLVLRTDLSADPTFRELLGRVRQVSVAAYDHQDLPFEKLVEELRPDRQLNRSHLFQAMFQLLSFPDKEFDLHNLDVSRIPSSSQRIRFDLEMHVRQRAKTLSATIAYSTDLFDDATIARMATHFVTLLEGIVGDPDQRISKLPLLTEPERHQLLVEWNNTNVDHPSKKCVHELFEEQVERNPDAVAIVFEEQKLSYRELNERANQLAHHVKAMGVGPETLVGLCLERSPELVISILGILKSGGAYVPLDADAPPQRLKWMLADAKIEVLVTQESLRTHFPAGDLRVVCLGTDAAKLREMPPSNLTINTSADSLAYVMYTSGSTGQPKGVEITHRSVSRLVRSTNYIDLTPLDCIAHVSHVSFDAATFEIWGALLCGGRLVISSKEIALSTRDFAKFLRRYEVTTLFLTTSLFNQHIAVQPDIFATLKQVLFGGESVDVQTVRKVLKDHPPARLLHVYGPTENTTFTSWQLVQKVASNAKTVPIGRPIANTELYVLDKSRQPVPIGVSGELYVGGSGLARGYLNRPELTAEKFVTHPFSEESGSRLYRTGDLCRWRSDGNLEFMGRIDDQVKLRGYRIELGEIEAAMNEHPSVAQGVVALREDRPGDKRLVAYCVAASDCELKFTELRSYLQQRLPDYMLPAAFVRLETMPLTSSGKINRRALPAPDDSRPELENGYVGPRSPLEDQLTQIWCEVLQLERVGVHDNFFALGGHSLLVARMVGLIDRHCRQQISIALVFRNPTIAELARCLDGGVTKETISIAYESRFLKVLRKGDGKETLVCIGVPIGQLMLQLPPQVTILQLNTDPHLQWGIEQFADAFVLEVERAAASGPIMIVGYSYGGLKAFALAGRLRRRGRQSVELVMIEPSVPSWKHKLAHTPAESRTERIGRHLGNLRAGGAKGWATYMMEKVSWVVWRQQERWEHWLINWKIKLNLPLKTHEKQKYNGSMQLRNIRNYSVENLQGNAHLLGSATYIQKHKDFWQRAVEGECRTRLLTNNSHHLDILDPAKSDEWIGCIAELARSTRSLPARTRGDTRFPELD